MCLRSVLGGVEEGGNSCPQGNPQTMRNKSLTSPSAGGVINQSGHFGHVSEIPVESFLTAYSTDHQTLVRRPSSLLLVPTSVPKMT